MRRAYATMQLCSCATLLAILLACRKAPEPIPQPHFRAECTAIAARRVGWNINPPVAIRRVRPAVRGVNGIVIIETIIDANGIVCDAAVLKGINPEVDAAALAAVKQWRFEPARANGRAVAVYFDVSVKLPPRDPAPRP